MVKSLKKIMLVAFALSLATTFISFARNEGMSAYGPSDNETIYIYKYSDGNIAVNEWKQVWDCWYYFDENGKSKQNTWAEIHGKWYYFDNWSIMLHDTTTPDGFQVGADGAWITEPETPVDTSAWLGTYKADDDQIITVVSAENNAINIIFEGYSEEGWYKQEYTLLFTDIEKKQAVNKGIRNNQDVYTLTPTGIEVKVEPSGGWKQGMYVKL